MLRSKVSRRIELRMEEKFFINAVPWNAAEEEEEEASTESRCTGYRITCTSFDVARPL